MTEWRNCRLGEVVTLKRGYDLPRQHRADGDVPIVSSSGTSGYHNAAKVKGPGVVTGRYGTLGEVFYVKEDFWPLNTSLYVEDFRGNHCRFISYFLRTLNFANQNAAGAVPGVNRNALHMLAVRIPPNPVQERIVGILSAYDDLIENNARRIRNLEEMAQAIYREWFIHFRFLGHKKVKLVNSPLGPIPEGWRVGHMAGAASISRDGLNPGDFEGETFEHFSIPAFDQGGLPTLDSGGTIKSNKFLVTESCVLLSKLNPRIPRVWLPIFSGAHRAVASTEFLVLTAGSQSSREFLYCLCASPEFLGAFGGRALGTSTSHQRVKPDDFLSTEIVVPGKPIILEFSELVAPMLSGANTLRLKNQILRQTRDLLLPKLISGELDVSDLDIRVGDTAA